MSRRSQERIDPQTLLFVDNRTEYFISHRLALARAARHAGYDVHVTTLTSGNTVPIVDAGFTYHCITDRRRSGRILDEGKLVRRLGRLYRKLRPDLIHHITLRAILYGGLLARFMRVPGVVNSVTGLGYLFSTDTLSARLVQGGLGAAIGFGMSRHHVISIFQNSDDRELFLRRNWTKDTQSVLIKGSGVDLEAFTYAQPDLSGPPLVLFASRLLQDKGIVEFVSAAGMLRKEFPNVVFAAAGERDSDNPSSVNQETLTRWATDGAVKFLGHHEDMPNILSHALIICLPSYREGMPKVLIEAAACGRAIVTTDVPGCREIVTHGVNGVLVPPRDGGSLADALRLLLRNPDRCITMGVAGRRMVEAEYSLTMVTEQTLDVYSKLFREIEPVAT